MIGVGLWNRLKRLSILNTEKNLIQDIAALEIMDLLPKCKNYLELAEVIDNTFKNYFVSEIPLGILISISKDIFSIKLTFLYSKYLS